MTDFIIKGVSEFEALQKEVRELQKQLADLTAERDDLLYHVCPALRAEYDEKIGRIERELFAAKLYLREKQRIIEIPRQASEGSYAVLYMELEKENDAFLIQKLHALKIISGEERGSWSYTEAEIIDA